MRECPLGPDARNLLRRPVIAPTDVVDIRYYKTHCLHNHLCATRRAIAQHPPAHKSFGALLVLKKYST